MGWEGDSCPKPLGLSICLALEPWHLLTVIVKLCQMTGQDSHGGPWSTLMHSCVFGHVHGCLWVPSRAKGRGQMLAQAAVFVMVACGSHSIGQKTCWEPLCHPNRPAWVTSNHSNNSFLGSRFRKLLSHYRRLLRAQVSFLFYPQMDLQNT